MCTFYNLTFFTFYNFKGENEAYDYENHSFEFKVTSLLPPWADFNEKEGTFVLFPPIGELINRNYNMEGKIID